MLHSLRLLAFILALFLNGPAAEARAAIGAEPGSPITTDGLEEMAVAWVNAYNAGVEAMAAYRADHFASPETEGWRDSHAALLAELGKLTVKRTMSPDPTRAMVGVESEGQGYVRLSFLFDDSGKVKTIQMGEERANPLPPFSVDSDDPRPAEAIDAYIRQMVKEEGFSGVVLLASDGEVWFERAYGLASIEFNVANTTDTRFDVGSFNKDYTRMAIMQLAQDGALVLSDTVGDFLPDYPNERVRREVTIQQLLTHRAGLGDYFDGDYFSTPMQLLREIDDYIPIWGPKPLEYEPGAREQYSNYGYTVLGAIVEAITGLSYPEYVVERIFEPAGMHETGFFETDHVTPRVAVGYTYMDYTGRRTSTLRRNTFHEPVKGGPWGKSYSTGRDLFRFFDALYSDDLVSPDFGWSGAGWSGEAMLAGGGPGLAAMLHVGGGLAVIVLANNDSPGAESIAGRLHEGLR
ncbi:MAG: D-alanyl-D-alanine carboxypeptidase [Chlamydiales bacterium]|jgi:D-alanyl-D-alanine carboxypeptidase